MCPANFLLWSGQLNRWLGPCLRALRKRVLLSPCCDIFSPCVTTVLLLPFITVFYELLLWCACLIPPDTMRVLHRHKLNMFHRFPDRQAYYYSLCLSYYSTWTTVLLTHMQLQVIEEMLMSPIFQNHTSDLILDKRVIALYLLTCTGSLELFLMCYRFLNERLHHSGRHVEASMDVTVTRPTDDTRPMSNSGDT